MCFFGVCISLFSLRGGIQCNEKCFVYIRSLRILGNGLTLVIYRELIFNTCALNNTSNNYTASSYPHTHTHLLQRGCLVAWHRKYVFVYLMEECVFSSYSSQPHHNFKGEKGSRAWMLLAKTQNPQIRK